MPLTRLVPPTDWPTLGWVALEWMETFLCHGPGDVQGQPLLFDEEFAQITCDMYRLYPKGHPREGRRVVREGGVSMAKGRAKSEWAGALVCFEFIGPCRFDGWGADGAPVGRPVTYPFIRPLATEEGQTGNTYGNVETMLGHALEHHLSDLDLLAPLSVGATRTLYGKSGKHGEIRPSTSGAASKDGGKESFCVADEPHLYVLPELKQMYRTTRRNSQKRNNPNIDNDAQSWMLTTTTMFEPGQDSTAEELYMEAEKQEKLEHRKLYGFCWHHRQGYEVTDQDDDNAILESLAEAYGPSATVNSPTGHMDPETILEGEFRAPGAVWAECVRYFFNMKHQGENKAFDPTKWDAQGAPARNNITGQPVVLWFDGSDKGKGNDHTVLGAWTLDPLPHCVLIDRWLPEKNLDGDYKIDRAKVRQKVTEVRQELDVVLFVCDPHKWAEQVDDWAEEFGEYVPDEPIVVSFDTSKNTLMGPAVDRIRELHDEEAFTHDGSELLRWYALNAMLADAKGSGSYHALVKEKHALKIDGIVGATLGLPFLDKARELAAATPEFAGAYL